MKDVLLIEDDVHFQETLVALLGQDEYRFFRAGSPSQGIRILEANPDIRVVLLDLSFQDRAGTMVLDHIRERSDRYRVIVLTAHEELLAAERAREYKVFNYLPKAESSFRQAIRFSVELAFKDLEREAMAQKIRFLQDVQKRINENHARREILDLICESVQSIVGAYTCHIRVYDFARGDYHLEGFAGDPALRDAFEHPRAKGDLFSGRVVDTRRPECFTDLQQMEEFRRFKREALERRPVSAEVERYWETVRSAYIVPISTGIFGEAVDAVLNVSSQSVGFFDERRCALVEEFVNQASLAITKDWLQRKRAELHEDYGRISAMLSDMRNRLAGPDVLQGIYRTLTQKLAELVNAEVVSIFLYNGRTDRIEKVAEYRGDRHVDAPDEEYERDESFVGSVFGTGHTLQLPTSSSEKPLDDKRFDHKNTTERYADLIPSGTLEHYLGVPIIAGGKIQGVLRAMNKKSEYYAEAMENGGTLTHPGRFCLLERGFSIDCRNVVEITASHLAIAIQNAELLQEEERRIEQLQTLGEVGRLISSQLHIDEVLGHTIRAMAEVMQAEICMLFLRDDGENRIVLRQCYGIPEEEIPGAWYEIGESVTGKVAETGVARLIGKADRNDGKYDPQIRRYLMDKDGRPRDIESLMVVPIIAKGTPLGVMKVINKLGDDPEYRQSDLELFRTFGRYVGVAVENAQIYELTSQRLAIAQRDAALSELVRAVAHEINNTAGLIPANIDAIRAALKSPDPDVEEMALNSPDSAVEEMLGLIEDVASQATEFANDIISFSAARRGEQRALDINEVIRSALRELDQGSYAARLTKSLAGQPLVCVVYETPFKQIVRNIVINAFQALAGQDDGVVTVSTSEGTGSLAGWAVVEFRDNGPGIRPEHLDRIFEADFTTKPAGNGIGLWLVRKQLEPLDGTIEVASEPGEGACFTVKVPLVPGTGEQGHT
ncbi:MAG: GAF domain-containing protein [Longimicrobiaceae bacterium]